MFLMLIHGSGSLFFVENVIKSQKGKTRLLWIILENSRDNKEIIGRRYCVSIKNFIQILISTLNPQFIHI